MASEATNGLAFVSRLVWKSQRDVCVPCQCFVQIERGRGGKRGRLCILVAVVFSPTAPTTGRRRSNGENGENLRRLSPSDSILPATDTLDCHYLFLHVRICVHGSLPRFSRSFYPAGPHRTAFPVSTLFAPFVAQGGGIVVADF